MSGDEVELQNNKNINIATSNDTKRKIRWYTYIQQISEVFYGHFSMKWNLGPIWERVKLTVNQKYSIAVLNNISQHQFGHFFNIDMGIGTE